MARRTVVASILLSFATLGSPFAGENGGEPRFEAVLINGGGQPSINFRSHLLHLTELMELLEAPGSPFSQTTIFSSDGPDPAADLAVRDRSATRAWVLEGTPLAREIGTKIRYVNSVIEGHVVKPATQASLKTWFAAASRRLRGGDTLLLYVTDHGTKDPDNAGDNRITLWGDGEELRVSDLRNLLAELDTGVRVVMLMSQCYSGAFADLMYSDAGSTVPSGNVCGYFSSTAQRPAYGCYPENHDEDNAGHSFRFIDALRRDPGFPSAHRRVLAEDRTPDVPLRTSDAFLRDVLEGVAAKRDVELNRLVDELLEIAWTDKARWETEIRLLDEIGRGFGFFSPRSMAEIDERADELPELSRQFSRYSRAWRRALRSLNASNLASLTAADAGWNRRLADLDTGKLDDDARRRLSAEVVAALDDHAGRSATAARLATLHHNAEASRDAYYRMQVRLGVLLRMKAILIGIAGRTYLSGSGSPHAEQLARLEACEEIRLPLKGETRRELAEPDTFPSFADDLALARSVLPGWMGIRYEVANPELRARLGLPEGAAEVKAVFPESPAERAGLVAGDFILGPPDAPFDEPHRIREWTMTLPVGEPQELSVDRDGNELRVVLTPTSYPIETPALNAPPAPGSEAPPLDGLVPYRGRAVTELAEDGSYLLFFWATWCAPCKSAVPELLAFESQRGVPVLAITDERAAQLEPFFETRDAPFPSHVLIDRRRSAFQAYGVSGTPSFVLVAADGRVLASWSGYSAGKGLAVDGWSWSGDSPSPAGAAR